MVVEGIMMKPKEAVYPDDTINHALKVMEESYINCTPVVDKSNSLVGMVEKMDVYKFLIDPGHYKICPVEWIMKKDIGATHRREDILVVASHLRTRGVSVLPVVEGGKVIGLITLEGIIDYLIKKLYELNLP